MNKLAILLLAFFSVVASAQNINDSLLIYYPFAGNAADMSGNGFDGIVNATLTSDRYGAPDEAYSFNGVDQFIDLPDTMALKPELPVSFSFWVKFYDLDPTNAVIFTTDFANTTHSGVWMNLSSTGYMSISYGDASGQTTAYNRRTMTGTTIISANEWYHVIGIVNGPTDMEIFLDCVNDEGNYSGSGSDLAYTNNPGSLGRKDPNVSLPPYYFYGVLDDFRYWNRALTETDLDSICSQLVSVNYDTETRITYNVYPNPVDNELNIRGNSYDDTHKVIIYNNLGQLVYKGKLKRSIDVTNLQSGIYLVNISDNYGSVLSSHTIIKN